MQEEIENRTINLAVSTTRLTARAVMSAFHRFDEARKRAASEKNGGIPGKPTGKQTVKQLIGQNQGVTSIDIAQTDLRGLEKYLRAYGIDYAITKDKSSGIAKYLCFFKARDADAMTAAFRAYSTDFLNHESKPSVLKQLAKLKDRVQELAGKSRNRQKERSLDR